MSKQDYINNGFRFIAKNDNGVEVYAKFTGYHDNIQYYMFNGEERIGDVQVTSYSWICMMGIMNREMNPEFFKLENFNEVVGNMNKWQDKNGNYC